VIVLDWGIAKRVGEAEEVPDAPDAGPGPEDALAATEPGRVLGTPAYMSPEQAAGRLDEVGFRSDVYSLGAMLYEVLTGRPPFLGANPSGVLHSVITEPPAAPRGLNPEAPRALEAVCLKAIAKAPGDRYASALELAREVQNFLADAPVDAYREP